MRFFRPDPAFSLTLASLVPGFSRFLVELTVASVTPAAAGSATAATTNQ
jgi:hypothetical protein